MDSLNHYLHPSTTFFQLQTTTTGATHSGVGVYDCYGFVGLKKMHIRDDFAENSDLKYDYRI